MNPDYTVLHATPDVATYQMLRGETGLGSKSSLAATKGLPNSLFSVQLLHDGQAVGMGRVVGDGGNFFQVVDIAVLPAHQGKGLGKLIMREICAYLEASVPETGYVSLIADGLAKNLYAQFGFVETAPKSVGMALPVKMPRSGTMP